MLEICCRICLNNDVQSFDITSELYKRFFTEIIGYENVPATIYLCIWCRSIFRKIHTLVTTAVHNMKLLSKCKEYTQVWKATDKRIKNVFQLTYKNEHIDIPPTSIPPMDIDIREELLYPKIEYINVGSDEELDVENLKREDNLDVEETFDLRTNVEVEENETLNIQNKKQINYNEMKFEVRYLNLEEQLAEIESKRSLDKFNRMKFKCFSCGIGFLTSEVFEAHQKRHEEAAGPHECATCHLRFKTQDVLSHHTLSHRRRFSCRLCPAVFNRWSHCVRHRFKCGVDSILQEPAVCGMCHKIFSDKYTLSVHVKGVHKACNYACYECDKKFISKQRLTVHIRSHTGARPFACKLCPRTFAHHSNLVSHQATHDPTRPHYCVECDTRYKTRRGLYRHLAEATCHATKGATDNATKEVKKYSCSECPKQYISEKRLENHFNLRHVNTLNSQSATKCQQCEKVFTSRSHLTKHIMRAHFL